MKRIYSSSHFQTKRGGENKITFILSMLTLLSFAFFGFAIKVAASNNKLVSPVTSLESKTESSGVINQTTPNSSSGLNQSIQQALEGTKGIYAIVVKNLQSGEFFAQNEDLEFESGSLYKLWVMGTTYGQINDGVLQKDQVLSSSIESLNRKFDIDPENAELKEGGISLTVSSAINQMITISHNYAALLLSDKVKNTNTAEFLQKYGLSSSKLGQPPKTTAKDIAKFFEALYYKQIINSLSSEEMLEILKQQKLNGGLPKELPEGTVVAHKTGEIGWYKHDAGIVFTPSGDYIIVVLSKSHSPLGAQDRIAKVSRTVFDYFKH